MRWSLSALRLVSMQMAREGTGLGKNKGHIWRHLKPKTSSTPRYGLLQPKACYRAGWVNKRLFLLSAPRKHLCWHDARRQKVVGVTVKAGSILSMWHKVTPLHMPGRPHQITHARQTHICCYRKTWLYFSCVCVSLGKKKKKKTCTDRLEILYMYVCF